MIPIKDENPSGKFPISTVSLIVINSLVFIYMLFLSPTQLNDFILNYSFIPVDVLHGHNLYTIITALFIHASLLHILSNMLFLGIFGNNLEYAYGHIGFLVFYFICGVGAFALQTLFSLNSNIPNLGASGAIAGIMGGYLVLFPKNRIEVWVPLFFFFGWIFTMPAYYMILFWIVLQLISGIGGLALPNTGGVAYFAHVGGFASGYGITLLLKKNLLRKMIMEHMAEAR